MLILSKKEKKKRKKKKEKQDAYPQIYWIE